MFLSRVFKAIRKINLTSNAAGDPKKTKVVGLRITLQMMGVIGLLLFLKAIAWNELTSTSFYPFLSGLIFFSFSALLFKKKQLYLSSWVAMLSLWIIFTLVLVFAGKIDGFIFGANFIMLFLIGMFLYDLQAAAMIGLIVLSVLGYFWFLKTSVIPSTLPAGSQVCHIVFQTILLILAVIISRVIGRELDRLYGHTENLTQQYQAIFDQSADAIFLTDLDFIIQELNSRAAELVKLPLEDVIGSEIHDYVPPAAKHQVMELANDILQDGKISKIKMTFKNKDAVKLHLQVSANLIYHNDETPDHIQIIVRDITETKMVEERIQRLALQDHLTKVENRLSLNYRVNSLIAKMHRDGGRFAMVYFDLDNFKSINDRYGHFIGDQLLIAFTKRLHGATREEDFLARMGGDEFVLIFDDYQIEDDLVAALNRIRSTLSNPFKIGDHLIHLQASYGISRYPEDGDDFEELLKVADSEMYSDKRKSVEQLS